MYLQLKTFLFPLSLLKERNDIKFGDRVEIEAKNRDHTNLVGDYFIGQSYFTNYIQDFIRMDLQWNTIFM